MAHSTLATPRGSVERRARVLLYAVEHHGTIAASAARGLRISKARMSEIVSRLLSRGLIWRRSRGPGGRVASLYPTGRGKLVAARTVVRLRKAFALVTDDLSADEREATVELLRVLALSAERAAGSALG